MQSLQDLENTIIEIQSIFNSIISTAYNDLVHASNVLDPIIESQQIITSKLTETIDFLNSNLIEVSKGDRGLDGLSAYQIALTNGFQGTEQEWLNSLIPTIPNYYPPILIEAKSDFVVTSTTPQTIVGLSYNVKAGEVYEILGAIEFLSTVTTTGLRLKLVSPSSSVNFVDIDIPITQLDGNTIISNQFPNNSYGGNISQVVSTGVNVANQFLTAIIRGFIIIGSNGTIEIQIGSEVNNSTVRFLWGNSKMILKRVK